MLEQLEHVSERVEKFVDTLLRFVSVISNWAFIVAGLAIIALSVGYAFTVPFRVLGVSLAAVGSIIGTAIVCLMIPKLVEATMKGRLEMEKAKVEDEAKKRADAELRLKRAEEIEAENVRLENQIHYLQRQRINEGKFTQILTMQFLEIESSWTDFRRIKKEQKNSPFERDEDHEYVGVMDAKFKGRMGIDLEKLKFHDRGDVLVISGLQPEFHPGPRNFDWLLSEARVKKIASPLLPESYEILNTHPNLMAWKDEHSNFVNQRINQGAEFRWLHESVKRIARDFLKIILQPTGRCLEFTDDSVEGGCGLDDYIKIHNLRIESQEQDLRLQKK